MKSYFRDLDFFLEVLKLGSMTDLELALASGAEIDRRTDITKSFLYGGTVKVDGALYGISLRAQEHADRMISLLNDGEGYAAHLYLRKVFHEITKTTDGNLSEA